MKVILTIPLLFICSIAFACDCKYSSLRHASKNYRNIIVGEVLEQTGNQYKVRILKKWKGDLNIYSPVTLSQGMNSCDMYKLINEETYLFYFNDNSISICSRSEVYKRASDVDFLDKKFRD